MVQSKLPPAPELAAELAAGATLDDLVERYDAAEGTIRSRILRGGFSTIDGSPVAYVPEVSPDDELPVFQWNTQPWAEDALCSQTDPEAFFPEKGGSTREAKSVCASCTVAAECLDWALEHNERFGIWGGLSERERRKIAAALNTPTTPQHDLEESA